METALCIGHCPSCNAEYKYTKAWTSGGVNDYGGWVVKCTSCNHIFHTHIGRDVNDSAPISGIVIVEKYDDEVEGDKQRVLSQYNLTD